MRLRGYAWGDWLSVLFRFNYGRNRVVQGSFPCKLFLALSNIINRSNGHDEALLLQLLNCILCLSFVDLVVGKVYYAEGRDSRAII